MQIHEKSRIIDRDNEWYIDATLTDDDWYEIEQAEEAIEPWLRLN